MAIKLNSLFRKEKSQKTEEDRAAVLAILISYLCANWGENGEREISLVIGMLDKPDNSEVPLCECKHMKRHREDRKIKNTWHIKKILA